VPCEGGHLKDGTLVHFKVSGPRRQFPTCEVCRRRDSAELLCDGPRPPNHRRHQLGAHPTAGTRTCDLKMCHGCAREVGVDRHLCPRCAALPAQGELGL